MHPIVFSSTDSPLIKQSVFILFEYYSLNYLLLAQKKASSLWMVSVDVVVIFFVQV